MKIFDVELYNEPKLDNTDNWHGWSEVEVLNEFNMPIPDKVRLYLSPSLIEKMKEASRLVSSEYFHEIRFLSNPEHNSDISIVEFIKNDKHLDVSQHKINDYYINTISISNFLIVTSSLYKNYFVCEFAYQSDDNYFTFKTVKFEI